MEKYKDIQVRPHNTVETPLSKKGHKVSLNLLHYYSRFIADKDKDLLLLQLLQDAIRLSQTRQEEHYLDFSTEELVDFYRFLMYLFKRLDSIVKNEEVKNWVWLNDKSPIPYNLLKTCSEDSEK